MDEEDYGAMDEEYLEGEDWNEADELDAFEDFE